MPWFNYASSIWAFWWILPLVGMVVCIAFMIVMSFSSRFRGRRFGCCGWGRYDETESLRREIRQLRDELAKVKTRN
jgi:hypothetical protein